MKSVVGQFINEERQVKDKLVNISLLVSAIAGFPLMVSAVVRAIIFHNILFLTSHTSLYLFVLFAAVFRKRLNYNIRAYVIIFILFALSFLDFVNTGFISIGFLWMTTAVVLSVLYFNLARGIFAVSFGLILILSVYFLKVAGFITYDIDYDLYASAGIIMVMRTFSFLITSLMIIFSIKLIYGALNENVHLLEVQKEDLLKSTERLTQEIEIRKKSEQFALENEYKFRNIFETSTDPIAIIDMGGRFLDFNNSFIALTGHTALEISGLHFLELVPLEYRNLFDAYDNNLTNIPLRFEMKYVRSDGELKFLDVSMTRINYTGIDALLSIFRDNTEKISRERSIFSAVLDAEEKERFRMSKELHDGLGPLLSTLKIYFEVLEKRPGDVEIQNRINTTLSESIKSVKEISNNLSPYVLQNLGVVRALRGFIEKITFNRKIEIAFDSNIESRFSEKIEIAIYRLVTELLNNTIKHAQAQNVNIKLMISDSLLNIHYDDDGVGFNKNEIEEKSGGIGLFNIKSRVEKLGGEAYIETSKGKGFKFSASINYTELT